MKSNKLSYIMLIKSYTLNSITYSQDLVKYKNNLNYQTAKTFYPLAIKDKVIILKALKEIEIELKNVKTDGIR